MQPRGLAFGAATFLVILTASFTLQVLVNPHAASFMRLPAPSMWIVLPLALGTFIIAEVWLNARNVSTILGMLIAVVTLSAWNIAALGGY